MEKNSKTFCSMIMTNVYTLNYTFKFQHEK